MRSWMRGLVHRWAVSAFVTCCALGCEEDKAKLFLDAGTTTPDAGDAAVSADASDASSDPNLPEVTVTQGKVRGRRVGEVRQFLGIPYAKPPVGALRFAPPEPAAPFTGTYDAAALSPSCMQNQGGLAANPPYSEDCLTINVVTPAAVTGSLPVMVWIYGGAFVSGGSSQYDASLFAKEHSVIVVTFNYRVGALGFFSHPSLDTGEIPSGNAGFYDQQLALRWVKDNIAAFGGDAENVTVYGQSAGSMSACSQMVSPTARGLARRFILQSGVCTGGVKFHDKASSNAVSAKLAEALCPGEADVVACLRGKPADQIVAVGTGTSVTGLGWSPVWNPSDPLMPKHPLALMMDDTTQKVNLILGSALNEWGLFVAFVGPNITNVAELNSAIEALYRSSDVVGKIKQHYVVDATPAVTDETARNVYVRLVTDSTFRCPARKLARLASARGSDVYLYSFEQGAALHAFDVPYTWSRPDALLGAAELNETVRGGLQGYWSQFARTGDPNGGGLPAWPKYTEASDQYMTLKDPLSVGQGLAKSDCDVWDMLPEVATAI